MNMRPHHKVAPEEAFLLENIRKSIKKEELATPLFWLIKTVIF